MRKPPRDPTALVMFAMLTFGWILAPWAVVGWLCVLNLHLWRRLRAAKRRSALAAKRGWPLGRLAGQREPRAV